MRRSSENTLYAFQAKQVKLLESRELKRIGDLIEKRNLIEAEKLKIMQEQLKIMNEK